MQYEREVMLTSVNDLILDHPLTSSSCLLLVNPVGLVPVLLGNQAEGNGSICELGDTPDGI